jgi:GNAT superfamily N-acetyltransferase
VQVVRAEAGDWERIREIRLRSLREDPEAFGSTLEREEGQHEEQWRAFAAGWDGAIRQVVFAAADEGGRWIGIAMGVVWAGDPSLANLIAMWVDAPARGRGVGEQLVERVAAWALDVGADRLELCVTERNAPASRLYARAGFVPTGLRDELRPGSGIATVTLRRSLGR